MTPGSPESEASLGRIGIVGLLVGFLLNLTGWLGNNFLLGSLWSTVGEPVAHVPWRDSIWRDVFSFAPDFLYGLAIAWLFIALRERYSTALAASLRAGLFVSLVGGVTTYFAIANSGFVPWRLALASFLLVLATKLPLAVLAGRMLERKA
jgi:hypothetical protein